MTSISSVIIAFIFFILAMFAGACGAIWAVPVFGAVASIFVVQAFLHFNPKE